MDILLDQKLQSFMYEAIKSVCIKILGFRAFFGIKDLQLTYKIKGFIDV